MNLILPDNIFTRLLATQMQDCNIIYKNSALITTELEKDEEDSIALIPTMDIIKHQDLFISGMLGMSFEGEISNTYIYFAKGEDEVKDIYLTGDTSALEVIFTKIFFKESFEIDVEIKMAKDPKELEGKNLLVTGDLNFITQTFPYGMSLAGEIVDLLELPFVNYVFASKNKSSLIEFNKKYTAGLEDKIYQSLENDEYDLALPEQSTEFIKQNITSVIYQFGEEDINGIHQLILLPYYHGVIKEIADVKIVNTELDEPEEEKLN